MVGGYSEYGGGGSLALSGHSGASSSLLWDAGVDTDVDADADGFEVEAPELDSCRWLCWLVVDVVRLGLRLRARAT